MAEILAISASVAQFLDIAVRLSGKLGSTYSDLRDVPDKLRKLRSDIDHQIVIGKCIQSSHATFWSHSPAKSTAKDPVDQTLVNYLFDMEQLLNLLQSISTNNSAGPIRRSWNAICAVNIQRRILSRCDELERQKSSILLWLSNTNIEMSMKIKELIETLQMDVDRTYQLTQRIEGTATKADKQLQKIPALAEASNATRLAVSEIKYITTSSHQQLLTATENTNAHVRALRNQWQELAPSFHEFRHLLQNSPYLLESVDHLSKAIQSPPAHSDHYATGSAISQEKIPTEVSLKISEMLRQEMFHPSDGCTCKCVSRATNIEPLSFLHFRKVFRRHHYRHCPKSKTSETSIEFLMKLIPPTWLMSHTIQLGISLHFWSSQNSWKISPFVVGTARLVDSEKSPAFRAIQETHQLNFSETGIQATHICALERSLKDMLECRQASVFDEDGNGSTLLHEVLKIYIWRRSDDSHDPIAAEFLSLIRFLLDNGSNPNVHRQADSKGMILIKNGGTALDIFASQPICWHPRFSRKWEGDASIYKYLVDSDAHFSRPLANSIMRFPDLCFRNFEEEMDGLRVFSEQVEVCDMNDLTVSIIRPNEADFSRAMKKDDIHCASRANGLTPIHFAIDWPWALKQLIDAGANIDSEDRDQRRPIHLAIACRKGEAAKLLLEAGCSIYTPDYASSLLQESLGRGRGFDHISTLVVDALIDRHTRLRDLALSVLPLDSALRKQINRETICEIRSREIFDHLTRMKCPIPPSLEPDHDGRGVYDTTAMNATVRLSAPLAERLWQGGFHRIDEPDAINGLTPLLQNWFIANFEMVRWFIEKGSSPFSRPRNISVCGLHLYAARIVFPGRYFRSNPREVEFNPQLWQQLADHEDMWYDSCGCLCSVNGCTPISIAIKQRWGLIRMNHQDNYAGMMGLLGVWQEKMLYQPEKDPRHVQQLLEAIVFERMNLRHTCCRIGELGSVDAWPEDLLEGKKDYSSEDVQVEYRQLLDDYAIKMLDCQCTIPEKPLCVVFRDVCGALSGQASV